MQFQGVRYPKTITYQGSVIVFGVKDSTIGYTVLSNTPANPNDDDSWTTFRALTFPTELRPVGMDLITVDIDSTKSRWDLPFQALSDGRHVYIFRQSTQGTLLADRFVFDQARGLLTNTREVRFRRSRKAHIPADRKDTFGSKDMEDKYFQEPTIELTMVKNLINGWFCVSILPTNLMHTERWQIFAVEFSTNRLTSFSILRAANGLFDLTDAIVDSDVSPTYLDLVNQSTPLPIMSGPASQLYMKQEQYTDSFGRIGLFKREARLMLAVGTKQGTAIVDFAVSSEGRLPEIKSLIQVEAGPPCKTALSFTQNQGSFVQLPKDNLNPSGAMTFEAWVQLTTYGTGPAAADSNVIIESPGSGKVPLPFSLTVVDGCPVFTVTGPGGRSAVKGARLEPRSWYHLAGTWDGSAAVLYVNGCPNATSGTAPTSTNESDGYVIGGGYGFTGLLAEVRLWNIARTYADILAATMSPVANHDPQWRNLLGYWRMDQPPASNDTLTTVPNSSDVKDADGANCGARWAPSNAPVGFSMAPVAWDKKGLSVAATLLAVANTLDTPDLIEGGDGQVHLYYRSQNNIIKTFEYIAYNTVTCRAQYTVPWSASDPNTSSNSQSGTLRFIAKQPGAMMNHTSMNPCFINITVDPAAADALEVTLQNYTGMKEVWPAVPRELTQFIAVLNGDAVKKGDQTYPPATARNMIQYDYSRVTITPGREGQSELPPDQGSGSGIFAVAPDSVPDNGFPALVQRTDASPPVLAKAGVDCWWLPAVPKDIPNICLNLNPPLITPNTLVSILNAQQVSNYTGALSLAGGLCMEAWINLTSAIDEKNPLAPIIEMQYSTNEQQMNYGCFISNFANQPPSFIAHRGDQSASEFIAASAPITTPIVGQWVHFAASYTNGYGLHLLGRQYLDAGNDITFNTNEALTIEAWVKIDEGGPGVIISKCGQDASQCSWLLYVDDKNLPWFIVWCEQNNEFLPKLVSTNQPLSINQWYHLAGVYDVASKKEAVVSFQGQSPCGYVQSNQILANPPIDEMTVELWVRVDSLPNEANLFAVIFVSSFGAKLYVDKDGTLWWENQGLKLRVPSVNFAYNSWNHIAGTVSKKILIKETLTLFVNGLDSTGQSYPGGEGLLPTSSINLGCLIDPHNSSILYPFTGLINEVRVWNRALTIDEIRQGMKQSLSGSEYGLVLYWPCRDRFGKTVVDLVGASNGSLGGTAELVESDKGRYVQKLLVRGDEVLANQIQTNLPLHISEVAV